MVVRFDADPELDQVLIRRSREAADRWENRKTIREGRTKALKESRPLDADSPARLALRVNRLVSDVRRSSRDRRLPDNPTLRTLMERTTPIAAEDLNPDLIHEVVLGARNFLSIEFLERGIQSAKRTGRILIQSGGNVRPRGTGFLVGPGLLLTNEHVLRSKEQAGRCSIEMDYELNRYGPAIQPQVFRFEPERFFINDPDLDFALVAVGKRSERGADIDQYGWLTLNAAQGKIAIADNDYLNIIQHPLGREKEVVIRENRLLDLAVASSEPGQLGAFLHYEGDTEKGSSGSPVLNDQWEVVALHHAGVPRRDGNGNWLNKDGGVWDERDQPVADIAWIANEGVRVSSLIAAFSTAKVQDHENPLLERLLSSQPSTPLDPSSRGGMTGGGPASSGKPNDGVPLRRVDAGGTTPPDALRDGAATFEVPLRISVSLGEANRAAVSIAARHAGDELLLERLSAEDYADRAGYDRRFLGVNVPFPKVKDRPKFGGALRVPRPARARDRFELRYHRFSVLMNQERRLAYVSACNVHFDPPATATRDEGSQSWRLDPRLDNNQQLGAAYYDGNAYDKGHLTRRDDAAWGRDKDDALAANWDTFHYTNAGPQHELFNRSDDFTGADLDLWGDLEDHISVQGGGQRARLSIFNGPIFGGNDKPLADALVPLAYFKIVIWRDRNKPPGAVGFVLEQDDLVQNLPEEAFEVGRFHIRQKRISWIEGRLDITFGPVTGWDRMPSGPSVEEGLEDEGVLISSVDDIVM